VSVIHVINRLVPGGAEKQLQEIARLSQFPSEIVELQAPSTSSRAGVRRLGRILRTTDARVVVAWLDRSQIGVALAAHRGQRLVAAIGGLPRRTGLSAWQMRLALARFDRLVANSEASRVANASFLRPLSPKAFDVIPNGVSVPQSTAGPEHGEIARIAFVGRNDPAKGLDVLVAALNDLATHLCRPFEAVFVGEGVPAEVARLGVSCPHEVHPRVAEPWDLLGHVDVLVVPSRSEGSPNVVLEAFSRHVPVVATTAGGIPELCAEDRAVMRSVDDPRGLSDAIASVVLDPVSATRRADRAFEYVVRAHAWARIVGAWDRVLQEELERCA
jgi:glycosyltransferase involved in cell wall biosynthesis